MALQPTQTHRAFTRPMLMQGGERKPMLANLMFCLFCVFAIRSIPVAIFGIIFYFLMREVLRRLANGVDPRATGVLNRHLRYKKFYRSHSTPWGASKALKRW